LPLSPLAVFPSLRRSAPLLGGGCRSAGGWWRAKRHPAGGAPVWYLAHEQSSYSEGFDSHLRLPWDYVNRGKETSIQSPWGTGAP
jgi:hypothetical protein